MKGIELPINILVIIAMAVIVLLGLSALYMGGFGQGAGGIGLESAKSAACQQLLRSGQCGNAGYPGTIKTPGFDANKDGNLDDKDTLQALCENYYGCSGKTGYDFVECCNKRVCGCGS
ncbi:MAG: hypothetical protein QXF15_03460 [Candidatus Aenigmatarchaeota archaeon]|nr:hypothetical protein [Candidatus Aenigmarchaeota archaeon]